MKTQMGRCAAVIAACCAAGIVGCVVEVDRSPAPPPDTAIEFGEVRNLGYACGGPLTSWRITREDTSELGTALCEQPILFTGLSPGARYTFDVVGYHGHELCWRGSCTLTAAAYQTSSADCTRQIEHLCGL